MVEGAIVTRKKCIQVPESLVFRPLDKRIEGSWYVASFQNKKTLINIIYFSLVKVKHQSVMVHPAAE